MGNKFPGQDQQNLKTLSKLTASELCESKLSQ